MTRCVLKSDQKKIDIDVWYGVENRNSSDFEKEDFTSLVLHNHEVWEFGGFEEEKQRKGDDGKEEWKTSNEPNTRQIYMYSIYIYTTYVILIIIKKTSAKMNLEYNYYPIAI